MLLSELEWTVLNTSSEVAYLPEARGAVLRWVDRNPFEYTIAEWRGRGRSRMWSNIDEITLQAILYELTKPTVDPSTP